MQKKNRYWIQEASDLGVHVCRWDEGVSGRGIGMEEERGKQAKLHKQRKNSPTGIYFEEKFKLDIWEDNA